MTAQDTRPRTTSTEARIYETVSSIKPRPGDLAQADDRLHAAIAANGGATECRERADEFTADVQHVRDSAHLVDICRECPVLAECREVAALMTGPAKGGSVIAGVRYDLSGQAVDLDAELHKLSLKEARRGSARRSTSSATDTTAGADAVEAAA